MCNQLSGNDLQFLADEGVWEVIALDENSQLAEAGVQPGDRITAIDGNTFDANDFPREWLHELGETVTLTVERDGATLELTAPESAAWELLMSALSISDAEMQGGMTDMPGMMGMLEHFGRMNPPQGAPFSRQQDNRVWLGVRYLQLDEQSAAARALTVTEGALLLEVESSSPAAIAGLQVGDIIQTVNDTPVDSGHILTQLLNDYAVGETVTLGVLRGSDTLSIPVTLEALPHTG